MNVYLHLRTEVKEKNIDGFYQSKDLQLVSGPYSH